MRSVSGTLRKPLSVLSATAHSTECTMTNTSEGMPSPNQIKASGNSAIAGSGLNIAVKVESRRVPMALATAIVVNTPASATPAA